MTENELGELYRRTMVLPPGGGDGACPDAEALRAVAERTGPEPQRLTTVEHAAACSDCQRDLALLAQVAGTRPVARRSLVPVTWLAAAATVVLAVAGVRVFSTRGDEAPVMRGEEASVKLVAPLGRVSAESAPLFVWHEVEGAVRYEVEVLGADAAVVATHTARDTMLRLTDELRAGSSYRWRVTAVREDGTRVESLLGRFELTRE
jgi:hypothetical protein